MPANFKDVLEEYSPKEIAEKLGYTYGYVRKKKCECQTELISKIQNHPDYKLIRRTEENFQRQINLNQHLPHENFSQYIIDYTEGNLSNADRMKFETELIRNKDLKDEYDLFLLVNEVMQGKIDLEEINAETSLSNVDEQTKQMIV
jgi:hypothetical protein